jgi:hypothetical protein
MLTSINKGFDVKHETTVNLKILKKTLKHVCVCVCMSDSIWIYECVIGIMEMMILQCDGLYINILQSEVEDLQ